MALSLDRSISIMFEFLNANGCNLSYIRETKYSREKKRSYTMYKLTEWFLIPISMYSLKHDLDNLIKYKDNYDDTKYKKVPISTIFYTKIDVLQWLTEKKESVMSNE